ncbi:hypothetical protein QCE63_10490 [Caballeronia sp. LZ065]|nr:hypothetical protein [Caballeronia sp. LZ065]
MTQALPPPLMLPADVRRWRAIDRLKIAIFPGMLKNVACCQEAVRPKRAMAHRAAHKDRNRTKTG